MTKKVLVITDAQNEFITGALGNKECEAAVKNTIMVKTNSMTARMIANPPTAINLPANNFRNGIGIVKMFFNVSSTRSLSMIYPAIRVMVAGKIRLKLFQITLFEKYSRVWTAPSDAVAIKRVRRTTVSIVATPIQTTEYRFNL